MTVSPTPSQDDLRKLAEAVMELSPCPWTIKPRHRASYGNEPAELIDAQGEWIASYDSSEGYAFGCAANPQAVLALLDERDRLREALLGLLDLHDSKTRPGDDYRQARQALNQHKGERL